MTRSRWILLALILCAGAGSMLAMPAQPGMGKPPGTSYKGPAFTFNKIADGVYHAVGTGSVVVMSNAAIIEGDRDCSERRNEDKGEEAGARHARDYSRVIDRANYLRPIDRNV